MKAFRKTSAARGGFTVVEMAIGVVLLLVMSGAVLQTLTSMKRMAFVGDAQGKLQRDAERALDVIVDDLRRTGFVRLDARDYPHLVLNGRPEEGFDEEDGPHNHVPAAKSAVEGDPDFGEDVGLLFVRPAMWPADALAADPAQAQRWPYGRPVVVTDTGVFGPGLDIDSDDADFQVDTPVGASDDELGSLVYDLGNPISYSLRTDTTGRNTLVRLDSAGAYRVVARDVERLLFERVDGDAGVSDAIRVRIFFRVPDQMGVVHRFGVEATVRPRNGGTGD